MRKPGIQNMVGRQGKILGTVFDGMRAEVVRRIGPIYRIKLLEARGKYPIGYVTHVDIFGLVVKTVR